MWGALSLLMTLVPSFRDFRLLNVIALAGTGFTAIYICVSAGVHGFQPNAVNLAPYNFQSFFTGANVFLWAYGGHGVSFEVSCSLASPFPGFQDALIEPVDTVPGTAVNANSERTFPISATVQTANQAWISILDRPRAIAMV